MSTPKFTAEQRLATGRKIRDRMKEAGETPDTLCAKIQEATGHLPNYTDIMALYQGTAGLASLPWSLALYKLGYVKDEDFMISAKPGKKHRARPRVRPE
jgi:hypothetical protein